MAAFMRSWRVAIILGPDESGHYELGRTGGGGDNGSSSSSLATTFRRALAPRSNARTACRLVRRPRAAGLPRHAIAPLAVRASGGRLRRNDRPAEAGAGGPGGRVYDWQLADRPPRPQPGRHGKAAGGTRRWQPRRVR